jgi:hypothetical protein
MVIEASRTGDWRYEIAVTGRNERLVRRFDHSRCWTYNRRGWTIPGLAGSIREDPRVTVAAFDFPFSIPLELLQCAAFAGTVEEDAFRIRANWARFVEKHVVSRFPRYTVQTNSLHRARSEYRS